MSACRNAASKLGLQTEAASIEYRSDGGPSVEDMLRVFHEFRAAD